MVITKRKPVTLTQYIIRKEDLMIKENQGTGYPYKYFMNGMKSIFGDKVTIPQLSDFNGLVEQCTEYTSAEMIRNVANVQVRKEIVTDFMEDLEYQGKVIAGILRNENPNVDKQEQIERYFDSLVSTNRVYTIDESLHETLIE